MTDTGNPKVIYARAPGRGHPMKRITHVLKRDYSPPRTAKRMLQAISEKVRREMAAEAASPGGEPDK